MQLLILSSIYIYVIYGHSILPNLTQIILGKKLFRFHFQFSLALPHELRWNAPFPLSIPPFHLLYLRNLFPAQFSFPLKKHTKGWVCRSKFLLSPTEFQDCRTHPKALMATTFLPIPFNKAGFSLQNTSKKCGVEYQFLPKSLKNSVERKKFTTYMAVLLYFQIQWLKFFIQKHVEKTKAVERVNRAL